MYRAEVHEMIEEAIERHIQDRHTRKAKKKSSHEGFDAFWIVWTRKIGKAEAEKAWAKISPGPLLAKQITDAAKDQIKAFGTEWTRENYKFQPHASTWLHQKRWRDQIESGSKPKLVKAKVLCACGCKHEAAREIEDEMWYLYKCWYDTTVVPTLCVPAKLLKGTPTEQG